MARMPSRKKKSSLQQKQLCSSNRKRGSAQLDRMDSGRPSCSASAGSSTAQSTPTTSSTSSHNCEIPGFYYDEQKKKYFKILPNSNTNSGVITPAVIQQSKQEKDRQIAMYNLASNTQAPGLNSVPHIISRSFMGPCAQWERDFIKLRISSLQITNHTRLFQGPESFYQAVDHIRAMVPNDDSSLLLGLWALKGSLLQRIQMLKMSGVSELKIEPFGAHVKKSMAKVTSIVWAPVAGMDCTTLHTTMCLLGTSPSLAHFRKLDTERRDEYISKEFNLGQHAAWTCAWNKLEQKFSVGSERKAMLIDFTTRRMWELNTYSSDIYSQQFSNGNSKLLYSGSKKGFVLLHDTRRSAKPCMSLSHTSPVCFVRLRRDENYLMSEDFSGQIALWDLRKCSKVLLFEGQMNEYTRLCFDINEDSDILYGVGQDSYSRIWSLNDGRLLRTLAPPGPASRDAIPCLSYSQTWGGRHHGLLMGSRDEIIHHSI